MRRAKLPLQETPLLTYEHNGTALQGHLFSHGDSLTRPAIILVHDAFGVGEFVKERAHALARLGYVVLAADLWGDGRTVENVADIMPVIHSLNADHQEWMGRVKAAHAVLAKRQDVDEGRIAILGFCFGGSTALEYLRSGADVKAAVGIHSGLEWIGHDWRSQKVRGGALLLTGYEDPMAASSDLAILLGEMSQAGIEWELGQYSQTRHGFSNPHVDTQGHPEVAAYAHRAARRSWATMQQFLRDAFEV